MAQLRENGKFAAKSAPVEAPRVVSLSPPSTSVEVHRTIECHPGEVAQQMNAEAASGYELLSMCAYRVGDGFGAQQRVLLLLRRAEIVYELES
jgi:hypothetical protein